MLSIADKSRSQKVGIAETDLSSNSASLVFVQWIVTDGEIDRVKEIDQLVCLPMKATAALAVRTQLYTATKLPK